MNIDRYLALTRPFFHRTRVTKRRLFALSLTMQATLTVVRLFWFFPALKVIFFGALPVVGGVVFVLMAFMNYTMFKIAAARRRKQASKPRSAVLKKNVTCLLAVACFFVCYVPLIVYSVFKITPTAVTSERNLSLLRLWGNTILYTSSTWNCLIFFWRNEILRSAGKKLVIACLKCKMNTR